jgi:NifU-like protein involved in Fe-S cluster formation
VIDELYSERLRQWAACLPPVRAVPDANASACKHARLCGSEVCIDLLLDGNTVTDFGLRVEACALGRASAAILAHGLKGASFKKISKAYHVLQASLKGEDADPPKRFKDVVIFQSIKDYKNRHASVLLPWEATLQAFKHQKDTPS